ncbi:MAG TPA: hypothetical protein VFM94_09705 [Solirubrobacterales bacterium]|nr:hypothetical protein [Solirubrobacterales bacterium]
MSKAASFARGRIGGPGSQMKGMGEMKGNKRLLIAGAITALAVLAVPALALSAVWKDHGTNVTKSIELKMSGGEIFETTAGNGMNCEVSATLITEGGSTGEITKFEIKKCPEAFGSFKTTKCEFNTGAGKGLPWTVDVNATDLTVTKWRTQHTFKGTSCKEPELDKTITSMTVTLEPSTTEISDLLYDGDITEEIEKVKVQKYRTAGTLTIEGANNKTYGIG